MPVAHPYRDRLRRREWRYCAWPRNLQRYCWAQGVGIVGWLSLPLWLPLLLNRTFYHHRVMLCVVLDGFILATVASAWLFVPVARAPFVGRRLGLQQLLLGQLPLTLGAAIVLLTVLAERSWWCHEWLLVTLLVAAPTCALAGLLQASVGALQLLGVVETPWQTHLEGTVWALFATLLGSVLLALLPTCVRLPRPGSHEEAMYVFAVLGVVVATVGLTLLNVSVLARVHRACRRIGEATWEDALGRVVRVVDLRGGRALVDDGDSFRLELAVECDARLLAAGYLRR